MFGTDLSMSVVHIPILVIFGIRILMVGVLGVYRVWALGYR
jgi:hypothetical protein